MDSGQAQASGSETIAFDFYDPAFQDDPHAQYLEMIEKCPSHCEPDLGWHAVFRHADIMEIVRDNENFSVRHGPGTAYADANTVPVLVGADPPLHTKQKKALAPAFNPALIEASREPIRAFVAERLDAMAGMESLDLMEELADQVPMFVICRLLDLPFEDYPRLREWVDVLAGATLQRAQTMEADRVEKVLLMMHYFLPRIEAKIAIDAAGGNPGEDMVSLLVKGRIDGERIPTAQILGFAQFLLVAGAATTTVFIGSLFNLMIEHPDQWQRLRDNPALIDTALEETLRLESPVHGLFRTNRCPMDLGDTPIEPDTKIGLMWFAGNLDPAVFENPLAFDIAREPKTLRKHLSFGHGLHTCIGGPLARMEGKVVVEEFMKRFEGLERAGPEVPYPYPTLNGPYKLPVWLVAKPV